MRRRKKPSHARIAQQAFWLWRSEGCPPGRDREHWIAARRLLADGADAAPPPPPARRTEPLRDAPPRT